METVTLNLNLKRFRPDLSKHLLLVLCALFTWSGTAHAWWDKAWTARKKLTVDTTAEGVAIAGPIGTATVLVRLHDGNFQFATTLEDGGDIRFVATDDKTLLPYHIERYDSLLNEAFVWVKVPDLKPGEKTSFWLYYGNPAAARADDSKATYDATTALVYHFGETGTAPADSSPGGSNADKAGTAFTGSLIGGGLRLTGQNGVSIPASEALTWPGGADITWSVWIKPAALQPGAEIFSRREGGNAFAIGLDNGVPYVEVTDVGGTQRSPAGQPVVVNSWRHLAVVSEGGKITLYLDGDSYATLSVALPALKGVSWLGKDDAPGAAGIVGFTGEIDELQIVKAARPTGLLKLAAIGQSTGELAGRLLVAGEDEGTGHGGGGKVLEHVLLFGDIARNMMFDGWIAVGICVIMIVFGWTVAIGKFNYLNSIQKGTDAFMKQWHRLSSDLTALDHDDEESIKSLGGKADRKTLRHMHRSPLYHLYRIGSDEVRHRVGGGRDRSNGLTARSMQAIRASLETGLVRENQRMNKGLIFLTISIAGGPYVGLLGTVVGVMITFAIIAKTGEVEVNSIAPGIASALLATVAGLVVAIPALFIYSYLNSRIKDLLAGMQVFIDEFIAKMAEFYPPLSEAAPAPARAASDLAALARQTVKEPTGTNHHAS